MTKSTSVAGAAAAAVAPAADADAGETATRTRWRLKINKKLLLLGAAALLLLASAGGATLLWLDRAGAEGAQAEAADGDAEEAGNADDTAGAAEPEQRDAARRERTGPPSFIPLDPFTVNLADREADRYAQVGITLELETAKDAEAVKQYMPAIRNNILMVLAHKTSAELLGREGKLKLADEVLREALRALEHDDSGGLAPVRAVQFSNFIVQ